MTDADAPTQPADRRPPRGPRVVAGRYELREALGRGGSGEVYQGLDRISQAAVAVKLLLPMSTEQVLRVRREVAALRILRLPGVVGLLDEGEDEGEHFIVMELVRGEHFPGLAGREWAEIGPRAVRLLEALALVHGAGVVHRDLKPANVLVDAEGRPRILDFGIARGPALGETITPRQAVLGTPRYLAPEQLSLLAVDARTDLYAVGLMLFEALAGRPPHPTDDLRELYALRVGQDAPRLSHHRPDLPRRVGLFVDRLLARRPDDRPRSAVEALADLGERGPVLPRLPRVGDPGLLPELVEAARAGRAARISGPGGSGRSRALQDAAALLEAEGRRVAWVVPGGRPFESLLPLFGPAPEAARTAEERGPAPWYHERLVALVAEGVSLFVDDAERVDRWTLGLLADLPHIEATREGGRPLRELVEAELRPIFRGPSRLLHLPEDAAAELFARAGGLPARLSAEVSAWVAAGLARWREGRVEVGRPELDRLAGGLPVVVSALPAGERPTRLDPPLEDLVAWIAMAWPAATPGLLAEATGQPGWELRMLLDELTRLGAVRVLPDGRLRAEVPDVRTEWPEARRRAAHAALARVLPPGAPSRFGHLAAAGESAAAAAEALVLARRAGDEGFPGQALGIAAVGLSMARLADGRGVEAELLREMTLAALRTAIVAPCEQALYELGRASVRSEQLHACATMLRAALEAWQGQAEVARARVATLAPFADEELECWRMTLRVAAEGRGGDMEGLLDAEAAWVINPHRASLVAGWRGLLAYRAGRFAEAAALHEASAAGRSDPVGALSASLNGVAALLDAGHFGEAGLQAEAARARAAARRLAFFEGRAEWALRAVAYRTGRAERPDLELVAAADLLEHPALAAQIRLTEAAVAWRQGQLGLGAELAAGARVTWTTSGFADGAALAGALELACRRAGAGARREAAARCRGMLPRLAVQALGLLAWPAEEEVPWADEAEALAEALPGQERCNEVLAIAEALSYCRGRGAR